MELQISRKLTIGDVKKQFSRYFPHLKLEFYRSRQVAEQAASQQRLKDSMAFLDVCFAESGKRFLFTATTSVQAFAKDFQKLFDVQVKVFRKAGSMWIETSQTDRLSLEKQNSIGEASSTPLHFNLNSLFL